MPFAVSSACPNIQQSRVPPMTALGTVPYTVQTSAILQVRPTCLIQNQVLCSVSAAVSPSIIVRFINTEVLPDPFSLYNDSFIECLKKRCCGCRDHWLRMSLNASRSENLVRCSTPLLRLRSWQRYFVRLMQPASHIHRQAADRRRRCKAFNQTHWYFGQPISCSD
jgi:hypothetical protein